MSEISSTKCNKEMPYTGQGKNTCACYVSFLTNSSNWAATWCIFQPVALWAILRSLAISCNEGFFSSAKLKSLTTSLIYRTRWEWKPMKQVFSRDQINNHEINNYTSHFPGRTLNKMNAELNNRSACDNRHIVVCVQVQNCCLCWTRYCILCTGGPIAGVCQLILAIFYLWIHNEINLCRKWT